MQGIKELATLGTAHALRCLRLDLRYHRINRDAACALASGLNHLQVL